MKVKKLTKSERGKLLKTYEFATYLLTEMTDNDWQIEDDPHPMEYAVDAALEGCMEEAGIPAKDVTRAHRKGLNKQNWNTETEENELEIYAMTRRSAALLEKLHEDKGLRYGEAAAELVRYMAHRAFGVGGVFESLNGTPGF